MFFFIYLLIRFDFKKTFANKIEGQATSPVWDRSRSNMGQVTYGDTYGCNELLNRFTIKL